MQDSELLLKLNWFYFLEINQYQLYKKQYKRSKDDYIKKVLDKFASTEKTHINFFKQEIERLGGKPTAVGADLGLLFGAAAGNLTSLTGTVNLFRINLALERRAIKDYRKLIQQSKSKRLKKKLWSNLIEEDMHHSWFAHQKKEFKDQKKSNQNISES
ncbi:ferritin-like domain-containing protein [Halanaerocella petrolearia]